MGINLESANARANELRTYATQLRSAKNSLSQYKGIFGTCWQGMEVPYYINAIGNAETKLSQTASELESIANAIVTTAKKIRSEEEAAEKAKREAEEKAKQEAAAAAAANAKNSSTSRASAK